MEIEAKFRLSKDTTPEQIEALDWGPFRLGARAEIRQHDTLWDTTGRQRLSASRNAVRLREGGAQPLVTLEGPGSVTEGVHEREELELPTTQLTLPGVRLKTPARPPAAVGDDGAAA